jgi:Peptidase family S41
MRARAFAWLIGTLVVATACTTAPTPVSRPASAAPSAEPSVAASVPPTSTPVSTVDAAADLDTLLELLEAIHPEPFHGIARDAWVGHLREIQASLAGATAEETMVEVMRLVASLSHAGRDGHQIAFPPDGGPMLPIRVFEFADGLFVTDALDPALVGARITALGGRPIEEVLDLLEPLVPRDSPATVPGLRPFFLLRADVLEGLGLVGGDVEVPLTLQRDGATSDVVVETIGFEEFQAFAGPFGIIHLPSREGLRYTEADRLFWTEDLGGGALYVRLAEVQAVPNDEVAALAAALDSPDVTRVIFDLRHNPGGNNTTYPYLLAVLNDVTQPLWVLTDRRTFSAASNLSTELEQTTDARFAGEPMGGGLNFWDDVQFIELEKLPIPLSVGISTLYWEKSTPDDPRLTIEPDLAVPYRSRDYFAGIDAGLEAVLAAP